MAIPSPEDLRADAAQLRKDADDVESIAKRTPDRAWGRELLAMAKRARANAANVTGLAGSLEGLSTDASGVKQVNNVSPEHRKNLSRSASAAAIKRPSAQRTSKGQAFLDALAAQDVTMREAAEAAGVSPALISRACSGDRQLSDAVAERLVKLYGTAP